jgi:hypothetical protein
MILKLILTIFALLVLSPTVEHRTRERDFQPGGGSQLAPVSSDYRVACDDASSDIRAALQRLSSGEYTQIELGRNTLLSHAKKSLACRKEVVAGLMERMDKPDLDFERDLLNYFVWREGSQLLGELKATEALDLLISHLDLTNGLHSASKVFQLAGDRFAGD